MSLEDLGEFGLIARLTIGLATRPDVVLGPGDDAAVLACEPGYQFVATCDAQVEGSHFNRARATAEQIGHRALAVNLSDIASMGAEPLYALISLILPTDTAVAWMDGLYAGLRSEAAAHDVAIIGGNVAATVGPIVLDITLLGRVRSGHALLRSGGRPGDRLCVTGSLGSSAAGLLTFANRAPAHATSADAVATVRSAHVTPRPRVAAGRALAASGVVTSMIDVSDGLAADLGHLCARSAAGAVLDVAALPIDTPTRQIASAYDRNPVDLALYGGEDYQLMFTVAPTTEPVAMEALRAVGEAATVIGWLTEASRGIQVRQISGMEEPLPLRGWDHLRHQPQRGA